jgi:hypothetical protein
VLLGVTGYIGYLLSLPLDIRHVAFASANLGYTMSVQMPGVFEFLLYLMFVLLIGAVNLWVSFGLALYVALKARGTRIGALTGCSRPMGSASSNNRASSCFRRRQGQRRTAMNPTGPGETEPAIYPTGAGHCAESIPNPRTVEETQGMMPGE